MSKKEECPIESRAQQTISILNIGVCVNKDIVSDFILNISLIYPKLIMKLCLIYDFFMINLYVTGYKLQVTSKIWRHIFVVCVQGVALRGQHVLLTGCEPL